MFDLVLIFLGSTLIASGAGKLASPGSVRSFVEGLGLPRRMTRAAGQLVGTAEAALGVLLCLGLALRWVTLATAILAAGFVGAHVLARLRGETAACRCFGAIDAELRPALSVARSGVLLAVAVLPAIAAWQPLAHPGVPIGHLVPVLSGVLSALTYILVFHLVNEAVLLKRRDREIQEELDTLKNDLAAIT
jgi:hypothetical protein